MPITAATIAPGDAVEGQRAHRRPGGEAAGHAADEDAEDAADDRAAFAGSHGWCGTYHAFGRTTGFGARGDGDRLRSGAQIGDAFQHHLEAELERRFEVGRLEVRRRRGEARAFARDVVVRDGRRRRRPRRVARRLVERGADHVVAEDPERLRGEPVVPERRVEVPQDALDEGDARGHVEAMERGVREESRMAMRHRPVFPAEEAQPADRVEIRGRLADAGENAARPAHRSGAACSGNSDRRSSLRSRAPRPAGGT